MIGSKLAHYEITSHLGTGGMGEVYQATDSKLGRSVAIKLLPEAFTYDHDRAARFEREARLLASLNHPNVAAIYGIEESGGRKFLVMELVGGETLAEKIKRGPIPVDEALGIAKEIAQGLEAAHEKGIIHRDLKPANVKIAPDGKVKILDFGLAKAYEEETGNISLSNSPTISMAATREGVILGTAAYMSPEQARGKNVDKRADIWAFGAVLFEMLTGEKAFAGDDVSDLLASVLAREPDWTRIPTNLSPAVTTYLRRCLQKDPKQRIHDIGDMRLALEGAFETVTASAPQRRLSWMALAVGVLGMIGLAISGVRYLRETPSSETRVASLTMDVAPADMLGPTGFYLRPYSTAFAISPDGATIVFGGSFNLRKPSPMLYRRPLAESKAVAIPGTEGAEYPFFSPDGQWVGFVVAGNNSTKLKKVSLNGGPPIDVCEFPGGFWGASWGTAGVIVFAHQGLRTVSDSGGKPEVLIESTPDALLFSPAMLPDGKTVLFTEVGSNRKWEDAHINAIHLTTRQSKTLVPNAADARYSPSGHLVFMRNAALLAVPFDAARVAVTGDQVAMINGIMQSLNAPNTGTGNGMGQFALSSSGMLIYASGDHYPIPTSTLVLVDRKGSETKVAEVKGNLGGLRLSSSGSSVVTHKNRGVNPGSDIWMYDVPSGAATPLTFTGDANLPLFLPPDGKSIMFERTGSDGGAYSLALIGSNSPQRMTEMKPGARAMSWSPDGKWLAYLQAVGNVQQLFVRPVLDSKLALGEPRQFSPSTFSQQDGAFSPDGRWIAYTSSDSGNLEVYVQAFPGPGQKLNVSSKGGVNPAWSHNGRELFFLRLKQGTRNYSMMAVDLSISGDNIKAGDPRLVLEGPFPATGPNRSYDVTSDGRFIINRLQEPPDEPVTKLNVILGWAEELKRRAPSR